MQIADLMTPDIEVVTPDYTVEMAAQMMADLDCELLPVIEDDRLVGAITGCDIATRVVAEGLDPNQITVREAMTSEVLYCFESEPVGEVSQKMMNWWVRRLPVVNQGKRIIGVVSLGDLPEPSSAPRRREIGMPLTKSRTARPSRRSRRASRKPAAA